ncbi:hypothetical protein ACFQ07_05110, partial [Actinomadura adrarensis]
VEPPWERPREVAEPVVLPGLKVPVGQDMVWGEGEAENWSSPTMPTWGTPFPSGTDWDAVLAAHRSGEEKLSFHSMAHLIVQGPEELVRPILAEWDGRGMWDAGEVFWMRNVVVHYGIDALPLALKVAKGNPATCSTLLLPYLDAQVATLMADWYERVKSARATATSWFTRHAAGA